MLLAPSPAWADDAAPSAKKASAFVVTPYLQLGHAPSRDAIAILWHAPDVDAEWSVEYQAGAGGWTRAGSVSHRRVVLPNVEPHRVIGPS